MSIPLDDLKRARRKLCRRIAACLVSAMAETDTGFEQIAGRLSVSEEVVRRWFNRMLDGTATDLNTVSDLSYAMDCEFTFSLEKIPGIEVGVKPETVDASAAA